MSTPYDVLFADGLVLDGSGDPGFRGSVAMREGSLTLLRGDVTDVQAVERFDATGLVIAPGFIDMHSHTGLALLADGRHEAKVLQGVTTEVIGVDGISYAPMPGVEDLTALVDFNAGLDGRPDIAYDWERVEEYLARFDAAASVNVALLVGNSALRICGVGWEQREATTGEVGDMGSMLREAMEEGAFGISTGLDYPPGSFASTAELTELSKVAGRMGGFYHTHARYQLGDGFLDPFREAVAICEGSDCPLHITHFYRRRTAPGGARRMLGFVEDVRARGTEVTFDAYPYPYNSTRLTIMLPMPLQAGGPAALLARLADPAVRRDLRDVVDARGRAYGDGQVWGVIRLGNFTQPDTIAYEGMTIIEIAEARGQHPSDVICDLLVRERLGVNQVGSSPDAATMMDFISHELSMVGSDSVYLGQYPSPRSYGTFPLILEEVREEGRMTLPEAIRKMTSFPAQRLGLRDRGTLRDGAWADVVVFDPDGVRANATYERPTRLAQGVRYLTVNGELVVRDGAHTGVTSGRALRR